MKIAYLILAHKNPNQLKRLASFLDTDDIYIHLDAKSDIKNFNDNVGVFIENRVDIQWGTFSMVEATLNLIKEAKLKKDYDYYVLLSGDDYFIKSINDFELKLESGNNYIDIIDIEENWKSAKIRYEIKHTDIINNSILRKVSFIIKMIFKRRKMINEMKAYAGSQWWCLNKQAIEYVIDVVENDKSIIEFFKTTLIPDELFFQTILMNSNLKNTIVNNNLRYIVFEKGNVHPNIFTKDNLEELLNEDDKYIARKFDINKDSKIFDLLDSRVR